MPINISDQKAENNDKIAWLCDDSWNLAEQMYALEDWLKEKGKDLPKGDYVADITFLIFYLMSRYDTSQA